MPTPYNFQENFELGTLGAWDSETDTQPKLNYRHYTTLVGKPPYEPPYRGAYCVEIDVSVGTTTAFLEEVIAVAASTAGYIRFYLYVSDLVMATSDVFNILIVQSVGPADELLVRLINTAGTILLSAGDGTTFRTVALVQNRWHAIELAFNTGSGVNATMDFFVNNVQIGAQITSITMAAVTQIRLGAMGLDAGTTAGRLLLDEFVMDGARIYPLDGRFPTTRYLTQTSHIILGPGQLEDVYLLDGGSSDTTLSLYDTDSADLSAGLIVPTLQLTSGYRSGDPYLSTATFKRGVYAVLGGTDPQAWITPRHAACSIAGVKQVAAWRK